MFTSSTSRAPGIAKLAAAGIALALIVSGCGSSGSATGSSAPGNSTIGSSAAETALSAAGSGTGAPSGSPTSAGGDVTLITHDSFVVDDAMLADFEAASGLNVTVLAQGDAGAMVNQLLLTANNPLGDAVFGIDNTFASKAVDAGILAPYTSPAAGNGSATYGIGDDRLSAVDYGDVCVNVDHAYFTDKGLAEPVTFEDLAKPEYKDLLVVESPATSSPGLAFLLGSIAHFGEDGWQAYWTQLKDNGVKVTGGWTDAYTVDFSGSSGKGARPLVVSYASSPPAEVTDGATSAPTGALLDTCFRQVEYAGVLQGAKNPAGAQQVVDFLLSPQFQASVPDGMYVYPVDTTVALPAAWQSYAPVAADPATLPSADIAKNRDGWISAWSDLVEG
jgi:thiamine transport system substrate-binding protein